ncbi:MAG: serine/threonine protein kinase [Candidatus Hydrogenedentes bacterium]|nr:serine/threonine protein kinase [Candidatus Hydrogenedentota bacterium]
MIALVLLVFLGTWVRKQIERPIREQLQSELTTVLNADVAAMELWIQHQKENAEAYAADTVVRDSSLRLTEIARSNPDSPTALLDSPAQSELRNRFESGNDEKVSTGYVLFDPQGMVLASYAPELIGKTPYDVALPWLAEALAGKTTLSNPFKSIVMLADAQGRLRTGVPTMFALAPVRNNSGEQIAVIAERLHPEGQFTAILQLARLGKTGETYAVDRNGLMLSQSRFDDELKQIGLVTDDDLSSSVLTVELRDPGVDMTEGTRPETRRPDQPLTVPARALSEGKSGFNVDGYRDYRGVPSVGAWTWLEDAGFGVVAEVDRAEAYRPVYFIRKVFWGLYALIALTSVAIFVFTVLVERLKREARKAALDAQRLGQYALEEKLGAGGMGVVYRARHEMLRRPTAVKLLDVERTTPDSIERFEREVKLTSLLNHPNTITIYDYGRTPEGIFYYAMEYLEGVDLERLVNRYGALPEGRVISILKQICGSLAEAHGAGLIHRDIKPANIMISARGGLYDMIKVLDFGVVKAMDTAAASRLTASGSWIGTPAYMSPEAVNSPDNVDARSDLYAVGAVGYFLLTGTPVFPGQSPMEILRSHVNEPPSPPSVRLGRSLDLTLENLILRCLAKAPQDRPHSAATLQRMLEECDPVNEWTKEMAATWWREFFPESKGSWVGVEGKTQVT